MRDKAGVQQHSSIRQVTFASLIGTTVEWYDFYLYGTTAALVFPRLFFPQLGALAAILASFGTFGVAFVARPLGGIVFGHFGDRLGRKSMLVITLMLMGTATFLIGLVPTFAQAGYMAPVLLVVLRFAQGLGLGGEWGGATLMVVEHAPEKARCFYASWPQTGAAFGLLLSTGVFQVFSSLPDEQFFSWGWRVPFLLSLVLIAVGLFIRLRIVESPVFTRIKDLGIESRAPVLEVVRDYPVAVILAMGVVFVVFVHTYIVSAFLLSYATAQLGVARSVMLTGLMIASTSSLSGTLLAGAFADRFGPRVLALAGALFTCVQAFPFFWIVDTGSPVLIWIAMAVGPIGNGVVYGVCGALSAELFPARIRYSGISLGQQLAGLPGAALTPIIAATLVNWSGGQSWPVAAYLAAAALLTMTAVYFASDKYRVSIQDALTSLPENQPV